MTEILKEVCEDPLSVELALEEDLIKELSKITDIRTIRGLMPGILPHLCLWIRHFCLDLSSA
jgi:hypothetical protein